MDWLSTPTLELTPPRGGLKVWIITREGTWIVGSRGCAPGEYFFFLLVIDADQTFVSPIDFAAATFHVHTEIAQDDISFQVD